MKKIKESFFLKRIAYLIIWCREELGTTGIGKGVAVPHTQHESLEKFFSVLGVSHNGVDFESMDGEPAYIIWLFLGPIGYEGKRLSYLERISTLIRDKDFRRFVREAQNEKVILDILYEAEGLFL